MFHGKIYGLFRFNINLDFRLHRVIRNHQQTQMTAFLSNIPLYNRYTQTGAFARFQHALLQTGSTAGWNT